MVARVEAAARGALALLVAAWLEAAHAGGASPILHRGGTAIVACSWAAIEMRLAGGASRAWAWSGRWWGRPIGEV